MDPDPNSIGLQVLLIVVLTWLMRILQLVRWQLFQSVKQRSII